MQPKTRTIREMIGICLRLYCNGSFLGEKWGEHAHLEPKMRIQRSNNNRAKTNESAVSRLASDYVWDFFKAGGRFGPNLENKCPIDMVTNETS